MKPAPRVRNLLRVAMAASVVAISACATDTYLNGLGEPMRFAQDLPYTVSAAWRQGNSIWLVPAKNIVIESILDENLTAVAIKEEGSYLRVESTAKVLTVKVEGVGKQIVVP